MRVILSSISTLILCSSFLVTAARAAPDEWYTYRYNSARTGVQPFASDLSDPASGNRSKRSAKGGHPGTPWVNFRLAVIPNG
jgi:hypothetical protein